MDGGSWHCIGGNDQDHPQEKEIQKGKIFLWGGLTKSCEKKQKAKEKKIYPSECRVPKNSKERLKKSLPQWSMERNRGKQWNGKD